MANNCEGQGGSSCGPHGEQQPDTIDITTTDEEEEENSNAEVITITDDEQDSNPPLAKVGRDTEFLTDDEVDCQKSAIPAGLIVFKNAKELRDHVKRQPQVYNCDQCASPFRSARSLSSHMRNHLGLKSYKCPLCPKDFASATGLQKHATSHQGLQLELNYTCKVCAKVFPSTHDLDKHLNLAHFDIRTHVCTLCNAQFFSFTDLYRHEQTHLKVTLIKIATKKPKLECKFCGKVFEESAELEQHVSICIVEIVNICDLCKRQFETTTDLQDHMLEHTKLQHECKSCGRSFDTSVALDLHHLKVHAVRKSVRRQPKPKMDLRQCPICDQDIQGEEAKHLMPHGRKGLSTCGLCNEEFEFPCALEIHRRKHFEEKSGPYLAQQGIRNVREIEDDELSAFAFSTPDTQYKPVKAIVNARDDKDKYIASFQKFIDDIDAVKDEMQSSWRQPTHKERRGRSRVDAKLREKIQSQMNLGHNVQQVEVKEETCEDNEEFEFIVEKNEA